MENKERKRGCEKKQGGKDLTSRVGDEKGFFFITKLNREIKQSRSVSNGERWKFVDSKIDSLTDGKQSKPYFRLIKTNIDTICECCFPPV